MDSTRTTNRRRSPHAADPDLAAALAELAEVEEEARKVAAGIVECEVEIADYSRLRYGLQETLEDALERLDAIRFVLRAKHGIVAKVTSSGAVLRVRVRISSTLK